MNQSENIYVILVRHFSGNASQADDHDVTLFRKRNETEYLLLKKLWSHKGMIEIYDFDAKQAWLKLEKYLPGSKRELIPIWKKISRVAAVAAIVVTVSIVTWLRIESRSNQHNYDKITATEVMEMHLKDGSSVWMNSNASLEYPEEFGKKERIISK